MRWPRFSPAHNNWMRTIWCATLALAASASTSTIAYLPDYGPFAAGQAPRQFFLSTCPLLAMEGAALRPGRQVMIYGNERGAFPRLRAIADAITAGVQVEMVNAQGRSLTGAFPASDFPAPSRPDSALCADLNRDGALDFVLLLASRGNGLGALSHEAVVTLSSGSSYRVWVIPTASPGPEDFLDLVRGAGGVIVKTTFRSNEEQRESRRHSYWVYNLIAVRGDQLVLANDLDGRFPKWVWYTAQPNHKPAASLSAADKARIWSLQQESMFREATRP